MISQKNKLCVASLMLTLIGCSQENGNQQEFQIKGAFGLNIDDEDNGLPEGYIIENKAFDFTPKPAHSYLTSYTFSITPNTHLIYGIKAKSETGLAKESCEEQRKQIIDETISQLNTQSPDLKISEEGNKWKIREHKQREITIDCESSITVGARQLVVTYQDTELSLLAYKEWAKRQSDITKFRP